MDDFTIQNDSNMKTCPESFWWALFIPKKLLLHFWGKYQIIDSVMQLSLRIFFEDKNQLSSHVTTYEFFRTQRTCPAIRICSRNLKGEVTEKCQNSLGTWEHLTLKRVRQLQKLRDCILLSLFFPNFPIENWTTSKTLLFQNLLQNQSSLSPIYRRRFWLDGWTCDVGVRISAIKHIGPTSKNIKKETHADDDIRKTRWMTGSISYPKDLGPSNGGVWTCIAGVGSSK